jgi:hypothetical protein
VKIKIKNVLKLMFFGRSENKRRRRECEFQTGPISLAPITISSRVWTAVKIFEGFIITKMINTPPLFYSFY